jgi:ATP:ADP antiporter, AAA family
MATPFRATPTGGWLNRFLRLFADVKPGEEMAALLMLVNLCVLLVGYYILKTVREPLVLATGGAEMKSYAAAGQALTLMGFIPLYGWLASRVSRMRLIVTFLLFFVVNIELFRLGAELRVRNLGFVFFIWVGIFSLATIAQFWSFANDIYGKGAGDRLFPLIAIGATGGSWLGSSIAALLFRAGVKPYEMMHISAALLLLHLGLYLVVDRLQSRRTDVPAPVPLARGDGFRLLLASPYLRLIATLLILLNVVNTTGEYIIDRALLDSARQAAESDAAFDIEAFIGQFKGEYFFWVNLLAVLLQAFVVSRLVKRFGIAGVLLASPLIALGGYGLIGAGVGFTILRWAKTAENAADYSIMNTARAMLWLPTTREEKYKAKQAADTFFVRFGDLIAAGFVFLGSTTLGLGVQGFARLNLFIVALWLAIAFRLIREHRRLAAVQEEAA